MSSLHKIQHKHDNKMFDDMIKHLSILFLISSSILLILLYLLLNDSTT